jgi:hypothetical protein
VLRLCRRRRCRSCAHAWHLALRLCLKTPPGFFLEEYTLLQTCETGAEPGLLETLPHPVDHLTSSAIFLLLLFRVLSLSVQASQGEMSFPELRRVANYLGER